MKPCTSCIPLQSRSKQSRQRPQRRHAHDECLLHLVGSLLRLSCRVQRCTISCPTACLLKSLFGASPHRSHAQVHVWSEACLARLQSPQNACAGHSGFQLTAHALSDNEHVVELNGGLTLRCSTQGPLRESAGGGAARGNRCSACKDLLATGHKHDCIYCVTCSMEMNGWTRKQLNATHKLILKKDCKCHKG